MYKMTYLLLLNKGAPFIEWIKLGLDFIIALIAITGVFFSIKTLEKSDRSHQLTLKEIEKADKRYKLDFMPLLKFEVTDNLFIEGLKFMSGEDLNFNVSSSLQNIGSGPALNVNLKVEAFYEDKNNRFRDDGKSMGYDIKGAYSLPIFKYDNQGELITGRRLYYDYDEIDNIYISLIGEGSEYNLPGNYISDPLERTAIDFFYANNYRTYNRLLYYITIDYQSIFGDKIITKQIVERIYTAQTISGIREEIDGVIYDNTNIEMFLIDKDFDVISEVLIK